RVVGGRRRVQVLIGLREQRSDRERRVLEVDPEALLDLPDLVVDALVVALGSDQDVDRRTGEAPRFRRARLAGPREDRADRARRQTDGGGPLDEGLAAQLPGDELLDRVHGRRIAAIDALAHSSLPCRSRAASPRAPGEVTT